MASDGRVTEDSSIFTDSLLKIHRLKDGSLLGTAGDADDRSLRDLLNKSKKEPTPKQLTSLGIKFDAILVRPDGRIICFSCDREKEEDRWLTSIFEMKERFVAIGSGKEYATGAMDRGASPEQAVRTAIKYSSGCGGKVQSFKLHEEEQ